MGSFVLSITVTLKDVMSLMTTNQIYQMREGE